MERPVDRGCRWRRSWPWSSSRRSGGTWGATSRRCFDARLTDARTSAQPWRRCASGGSSQPSGYLSRHAQAGRQLEHFRLLGAPFGGLPLLAETVPKHPLSSTTQARAAPRIAGNFSLRLSAYVPDARTEAAKQRRTATRIEVGQDGLLHRWLQFLPMTEDAPACRGVRTSSQVRREAQRQCRIQVPAGSQRTGFEACAIIHHVGIKRSSRSTCSPRGLPLNGWREVVEIGSQDYYGQQRGTEYLLHLISTIDPSFAHRLLSHTLRLCSDQQFPNQM